MGPSPVAMDAFNASTHHPLRETRLASIVFESREDDIAAMLVSAGTWVAARRVRDLALVAEQPITQVPELQVVEVSATPHPGDGHGRTAVAVEEGDLAEEKLGARLTRPKPVTLVPVPEWPPGRQGAKAAAAVIRPRIFQAVIAGSYRFMLLAYWSISSAD